MRLGQVLGLALLAVLPGGCLLDSGDVGPETTRWRSPFPADGSGLIVDVALLECPLSEYKYLNEDLWRAVDEQVVEPEQRWLLQSNGLRVGQIVGPAPAELLALLRSERSCVNPRRRFVAFGASAVLWLSPVQPECRFQLHGVPAEEGTGEVAQALAQCGLLVQPRRGADGACWLRCTPLVEYGPPLPHYVAAPQQTDWVLEIHRARQEYAALAWELSVHNSDYLVIGGWPDKTATLGHQAFFTDTSSPPRQRLLVLRPWCSAAGATDADDLTDTPAAEQSLPLAWQAAATTVRSSRP